MAYLSFKRYSIPEKSFVVAVHVFLGAFAFICAFPFLNVLARSDAPAWRWLRCYV